MSRMQGPRKAAMRPAAIVARGRRGDAGEWHEGAEAET